MKRILGVAPLFAAIVFLAGCASKEQTDAWVMYHHPKASIISVRNERNEDGWPEYILCEDSKVVIVEADSTGDNPLIKATITLPPDHVSCK